MANIETEQISLHKEKKIKAIYIGHASGQDLYSPIINPTPSVRNYLSRKWIKNNVSKTKIRLDISISPASISGQGEHDRGP